MIYLIIIMVTMAIWEIPRLIRKKSRKDLIAFIGLWLFSFIHSSLLILEIEKVNPIQIIITTVRTTKKIIMK
ncbi:MAG: hypothetical protein ACOCP5_04430 [Halanaerobiaceae bacterium]